MKRSIRPLPFVLAIIVGCLVNYLGDWLLGIRIELFWGLETFNFRWFLAIFVLPILVGFSVSYIYGLGGKWIAFFPPLIVQYFSYYQTQNIIGVPAGADLMPMGWWGFFVILAMEVSMIGGILGEIAIKRIYGRSAPPSDDMNSESNQPSATVLSGKPEGTSGKEV
ncbi:MAG TPA: hypothetical protein ENI97_02675 [Gammaproteobacteria bacterium]|nr:hypothetical protein [Gammaproteobacteria bacterium]